jgi:pimeloyl-ACP methyl ester carboxylesterase
VEPTRAPTPPPPADGVAVSRRRRHSALGGTKRPRVCGFIANVICSDRALDRVERRVERIARRDGRRIAVIGHSRGAHYARALAAGRPDLVSHAISLGADLQGMFGCSTPTLKAVAGVRALLQRTGRARSPACLSDACRRPFLADFRAPFPVDQVHDRQRSQRVGASGDRHRL